MKVGELFLALGLVVEDKQWSLGQAVIDQMAADLKKLAVRAQLATTDVKKAMGVIGISAPAKAARKSLKDMVGEGGRVASTFRRMMFAAAGFFAVTKVRDTVKGVVDLGGKLNDAAQQTGLSAESLQEWGYAASQNSSNIDEVIGATGKLAKQFDDVKKGKGPLVDTFRELGISLKDPAVKARNLDQIMFLVANKFSTMKDGADKQRIAMALFGRSGASLIPTLNKGAQGLEELRVKARELGVVIDGKSVGQLDDLGDSIDEAAAAVQGLKNQAVVALVPIISELVKGFSDWVRQNKELIRSTITKVVEGLVVALRLLGRAVVFVVDHWKVFAAILGGAVLINGMMALIRLIVFFQAAQTRAALMAVINWIMILGPIFLIAAALVLLGVLIYKYRDKVKAALSRVAAFFTGLWGKIKATGRGIRDTFVDIAQSIVNAFRDAFNWVRDKAKATVKAIRNAPVIKQIVDFVTGGKTPMEMKADYERMEAGQSGGAVGPTSSIAPRRSRSGAGGASVQQTNTYDIKIDAKNADAKEVATLVDQKLREHDERTRRQTAASLGIG